MVKKLLCFVLCALLLTGCTAPEKPSAATAPPATEDPSANAVNTEKSTGVGFYFDTVVTVTLYGAQEGLLDELWAACSRYENLLSKTIATSDISRINAANGQSVAVDPETWEIIRRAKEISAMTDGAFSITVAPLSAMWDFTGGTNKMPTDAARTAALPLVNDQAIQLGEGYTVTLPAGMMIDLGGIAKGYIADKAAELMRGRVYGAILSLGGNVYVIGDKPDGSKNSIAIQNPFDTTAAYMGIVYTKNCSVVTSGTYERFFEKDGVRYHHILDPKDGLPARSDLVSATFVMESSMTADALATACIVMGSEKSLALANEHGFDALFITNQGELLPSTGFSLHQEFVYVP